jgi:hypothetical protein
MNYFNRFAAATLLGLASAAATASLMPSFADVPTGWTTDRYAPASFSNVGTFQGRGDVLGISINSSGALNNRPAAYQSSFYNTQGMQHAVSGGAGSSLAADLFIETGWRDAGAGNVRSDMWGVTDNQPLQYPIIGFTNYGGNARYRVWDEDTALGWVDLNIAVSFGEWTAFEIKFTGSSYDFYINGSQVYSDATIGNATGFSAVIMQAYNFGDPSIAGAVPTPYTAHWSNAQAVPEPASIALVALAMLVAGGTRQRRQSWTRIHSRAAQ